MNIELLERLKQDITENPDGFDLRVWSGCLTCRIDKLTGNEPREWRDVYPDLGVTKDQARLLFGMPWSDMHPEVKRTSYTYCQLRHPFGALPLKPEYKLHAEAVVRHLIDPLIAEGKAQAETQPMELANFTVRETVNAGAD